MQDAKDFLIDYLEQHVDKGPDEALDEWIERLTSQADQEIEDGCW